MAARLYYSFLFPHHHARLAYQHLRHLLFRRFGFLSACALEPAIPLAVSAGPPPKEGFLPFAYSKEGGSAPQFRLTGPAVSAGGFYLALEDSDGWRQLASFTRSKLTPPSPAPPPLLPVPQPGLFLCAREDDREGELLSFISARLPAIRQWDSSKLAAVEIEVDDPACPWDSLRWRILWQLNLRRMPEKEELREE